MRKSCGRGRRIDLYTFLRQRPLIRQRACSKQYRYTKRKKTDRQLIAHSVLFKFWPFDCLESSVAVTKCLEKRRVPPKEHPTPWIRYSELETEPCLQAYGA